jgi:hypothetical protein
MRRPARQSVKPCSCGGVTRRFPTLQRAFLEGGVGWAADLYVGLIARWEKRNPQALENYNPANLNKAVLFDLYQRYGGRVVHEHDALTATVFNTKLHPFGARLRAIFSSDIGHWDVPDMTEVLAEAYALVEEEVMTDAAFCDFVFTTPVALWTGMNPDFFKGIVVEQEVDHLLAVRVK